MRKRLWSVFILMIMLFGVVSASFLQKEPQKTEDAPGIFKSEKTVLNLSYTDDVMTDYLKMMSSRYMSENEDVIINLQLADNISYLDDIYESSIQKQEDMPDLFITTDDTLEKACLSGIAAPVPDPEKHINEQIYPAGAINSVMYKGGIYGYPLYYDTAVFLYNKTHLKNMADARNEAMKDVAEAEAAMEATDAALDGGDDPELVQTPKGDDQQTQSGSVGEITADDLIPGNFEDILTLAEEYDAPEGMESILKWDVSDIFYNYFFIGDNIEMCGVCGDDPSKIDLCNDNAVACMEVYQALKSFFSIDARDSDYENILNEFIEGKTLFTIVSVSSLKKIREAAFAGQLQGEYGVATLPDLTENLHSRPLSVTGTLVVNGLSYDQNKAHEFAEYLSENADEKFYEMTGYPAANLLADNLTGDLGLCMTSYEKSVHLPKLMSTSDFWMQLEIAMAGIWEGNDTVSTMQSLEDKIISQVR